MLSELCRSIKAPSEFSSNIFSFTLFWSLRSRKQGNVCERQPKSNSNTLQGRNKCESQKSSTRWYCAFHNHSQQLFVVRQNEQTNQHSTLRLFSTSQLIWSTSFIGTNYTVWKFLMEASTMGMAWLRQPWQWTHANDCSKHCWLLLLP